MRSAGRQVKKKHTSHNREKTADLRHNSHVLNDSYAMQMVIPYSMQLSRNVGRLGRAYTGGATVISGAGERLRSVAAHDVSALWFNAGANKHVRRAQSVVKTCGNLSQSKAEPRWAAKSSHLDAAMQLGGIAQKGAIEGVQP
jgi:hypothetical protein